VLSRRARAQRAARLFLLLVESKERERTRAQVSKGPAAIPHSPPPLNGQSHPTPYPTPFLLVVTARRDKLAVE
jgi:hypothetical protein